MSSSKLHWAGRDSMVSDNRDKLELLVTALLEKETLDAAEVTAILGPRPGGVAGRADLAR